MEASGLRLRINVNDFTDVHVIYFFVFFTFNLLFF